MGTTVKGRIQDYFAQERARCADFARYNSKQAKTASYKSEKLHFENAAWYYGVKMPALLSDMEKDILRLV